LRPGHSAALDSGSHADLSSDLQSKAEAEVLGAAKEGKWEDFIRLFIKLRLPLSSKDVHEPLKTAATKVCALLKLTSSEKDKQDGRAVMANWRKLKFSMDSFEVESPVYLVELGQEKIPLKLELLQDLAGLQTEGENPNYLNSDVIQCLLL
jgi:hypothetical protein